MSKISFLKKKFIGMAAGVSLSCLEAEMASAISSHKLNFLSRQEPIVINDELPLLLVQNNKHMKKIIYNYNEFNENIQLAAFLAAQKISNPEYKAQTLSRIAYNYALFGQKQQADRVFWEAFTAAEKIQDPVTKIWLIAEITERYYLLLGSSDRIDKMLDKGLIIATAIEDSSPFGAKYQALQRLATGYARTGREKKLFLVFEQIKPLIRETSDLEKIRPYFLSITARNKAARGQYEEVLQLFKEANVNPYSFLGYEVAFEEVNSEILNNNIEQLLELARFFKERDRHEEVEKTFDLIFQTVELLKEPRERYDSLSEIARDLAWSDWKDKASEILERIVKNAPTIDDKSYQSYLLSNVAEYYLSINLPNKAIQTIQKIEMNSDTANHTFYPLLKIGEKFCELKQEKDGNDASALADRVLQLMNERYSNNYIDVGQKINIAYHYAKCKNLEKANRLLQEVLRQKENLEPNELSMVATTYTELGQFEQAFEIAKSIKDAQELERLAVAYAKAGNFERAFETTKNIKIPLQSFSEIATIYIQKGDEDKGLETIIKAIQLAQTPDFQKEERENGVDEDYAIKNMMNSYIEISNPDRVLQIVKIIKNPNTQAEVLLSLSRFSGAIKNKVQYTRLVEQVSEALTQHLQVVSNIQAPDRRNRALATIVECYSWTKQFGRALEIIPSIEDSAIQAEALATIAWDYGLWGEEVSDRDREILQTILQDLKQQK